MAPSEIDRIISASTEFRNSQPVYEEARKKLGDDFFAEQLRVFLLCLNGTLNDDSVDRLLQGYLEAGIPYLLVMGDISWLQEMLLRLIEEETSDAYAEAGVIEQALNGVRNRIAWRFLCKEAAVPPEMPVNGLVEKILIKTCLTWWARVREAITESRLDIFPLGNASDSPFHHALRYPESLMACMDLNFCDQIDVRHRKLHQQAALLYVALYHQKYEQALLIFGELSTNLWQLLQQLTTLYFDAQVNRLPKFLNFVRTSLYLSGGKYLGLIDLQGLDHINERFGQEEGDLALAALEQVLEAEFRQHQSWFLYTRGIGGDYYLYAQDVEAAEVEALFGRIQQALAETRDGPSTAATLKIRAHAISLNGLTELSASNLRLAVAYLKQYRDTVKPAVLEGEHEAVQMWRWIKNRLAKSIDLRRKLDHRLVDIFVQPLVLLGGDSDWHAFEVLGRFRDGEEFISAGMFIDDIIRLGLIEAFDLQVLEKILEQRDQLASLTNRLFINASPHSLESAAYRDALEAAVQGPLADFDIVIELTEQILFQELELVHRLRREWGITFAIDDFGTGFSSLQSVIELAEHSTISYLKLDGSLTVELGNKATAEKIMRIITRMAQELGMRTVIECVESERHLELASEIGLDLGQGYLLGIPDTVPSWLAKVIYLENREVGTPLLF